MKSLEWDLQKNQNKMDGGQIINLCSRTEIHKKHEESFEVPDLLCVTIYTGDEEIHV